MRRSSALDIVRTTTEMVIACIKEPFLQARYRQRFDKCIFYRGVRIDELSRLGRFNVLFVNATVINSTIGDHTFIQRDSFVNCAEIGKFCSIAMNVYVGPGQHPTSFVSSHPAFYSSSQPLAKTYSKTDSFEPFKKVMIGHDVWLGHNCVVIDGVTIGTGAVVGAGTVVTSDIPAYAIVGGVPARLIKYRFDEKMRKLLLESQWWEWSDERLRQSSHMFLEPEKFINELIKDKDKNK